MLRSWGSTTATATVLLVFVLAGFGSAMLLASAFPAVSLLIAATMTVVLIAAVMTRPQTSKL